MGSQNTSKKQKSNIAIENIKSKYILKIIINDLKIKRLYKIIKYNKEIQNRLEITLDDYKNLTPTKIKIFPAENRYGEFSNIFNKNEERYFHIYFGKNKKEINRTHLDKDDKVKKIKVTIDYQIKSFDRLFKDCICIEAIDFYRFYRNNITNIGYMFNGYSSFKKNKFIKIYFW